VAMTGDRGLAFKRIRELEEEKRILLRINAELNRRLDEVRDYMSPEPRRRTYEEKPVKCIRCGKPTMRPRRGMCPTCYKAWIRAQHRHTERLGDIGDRE